MGTEEDTSIHLQSWTKLPRVLKCSELNKCGSVWRGNECSVAKAIQSCSMKTVYKIITRKWIRLMLFSKFWSLLWQSARQPRHSMYFHGLYPSEGDRVKIQKTTKTMTKKQ